MIDNDTLLETVNVYRETGSQTEAAKQLGIARSTLQNRLRQAAKAGLDGSTFVQAMPGYSIKSVSTLYDADGNVKSQWIKSSVNEQSYDDIAAYFTEALSSRIEPTPTVDAPLYVDHDLLTVYPIADLHVGMLSWAAETGEDYDIRIVEDIITRSMEDVVSRSPRSEFAMVANLGDFFHSNDFKNMTPASGNILDVDTRFQKMIYVGVRIMRKLIERTLEHHKTVIIRNTAGNHDLVPTVALNIAMKCCYELNDRVLVEDSPRQLWAYHFGQNLIGMHHGDKMKPEFAVLALANDYAKEWGETKHRVIYSGHIHHQTVKEIGGVRCESFQTLAAKDAYAAEHGYRSGRSLQSITFHRERGEISRMRVNV